MPSWNNAPRLLQIAAVQQGGSRGGTALGHHPGLQPRQLLPKHARRRMEQLVTVGAAPGKKAPGHRRAAE